MESVIEVKNLVKIFSEKKSEIRALDDVSFKVNKGEIFGLLGPNGAGKTTSIRLIGGILKPTQGLVYINGQDIKEQDPYFRKELGFLTENHGNYERLTVLENLNFFGSFYDVDEDRIFEVLNIIGLFKRKDIIVGKLSKGQKQRLAIARSILHDPEIIFFDEPTAGLDPAAAVKIRELIFNLKGRKRTLFISSHNLEEVQKLCDRVTILDEGKVKRTGTPAELRKKLWDTQETVFKLKDPISNQIQECLEKFRDIKQYKIEENKIYIYSRDPDETTPTILKDLVNMGAKILEVRRTVRSLEDIYMKLMEEEN